jgi:hypothetical protein
VRHLFRLQSGTAVAMAVARVDRQLIERRSTILKLASLSEHAEYELNYLHEPAPALRAIQRIQISRFLLALLYYAVNSGNDSGRRLTATNTQLTDLIIQALT